MRHRVTFVCVEAQTHRRRLRPLPSGPEGAHQIINTSDEPARVLLVSGFALPRAAVQPDSGKLMIRWGPGWDESLWFRREDAADYWEGEDT
jgi:uncharacterized cupin superfamily protein